jgi:hypothetical protein
MLKSLRVLLDGSQFVRLACCYPSDLEVFLQLLLLNPGWSDVPDASLSTTGELQAY